MTPRFCTACGGALLPREEEGRSRLACPECGWVAYENPVPAAAVLVTRGRAVLLCRRAIEPFVDSWCLPAGFLEIDETVETAAVREVREETGLLVRLSGLHDVLTVEDDPRKVGLLVVFTAEEVGGELEPGPECREVGFSSLDALPDDIAFQNHRAVLDDLRRGRNRWATDRARRGS